MQGLILVKDAVVVGSPPHASGRGSWRRSGARSRSGAVKPGTGYVRVSTMTQATEGVSPDAQRAAIARWCEANEVSLEPGSIFVEGEGADKKSSKGLSGGRADNRPALQAALDRVCETGGVLVVYSLSRLARSVKDTLLIAERLDKAGADLVSLSEKIDTTSASGKMMFRLLAVLAEFERDLISERTLTALTYKRGKGERVGQLPFGQDLGPDGMTLVANPEEEQALGLMVDLAERGCRCGRSRASWTPGATGRRAEE